MAILPRHQDPFRYSNTTLQRLISTGSDRTIRQSAAEELERRTRGRAAPAAPLPPPPAPPPPPAYKPPPPAPKPPTGPLASHFVAQFMGSPTCCGTAEWGSFISKSYGSWDNISQDQLDILNQQLMNSGKGQLYSFTVPELGGGQEMAESVLPKLGFEKVSTFINPNGGRTINTWLWFRPGHKR